MSSLQIVTTSALLLACVYLSLGAHIPTRRDDTGVHPAITRTGTEAINAKTQVDDYMKAYSVDNVTGTCSTLVTHLPLPCPKDVPGCNAMVNASSNLHYLLYMYSHVLGFIYQSENSTDENQMQRLDLLEMIYYRLSHQMLRYLQAHNLTSGNTNFIKHEEVVGNITSLKQNFTYIEIAKVILCHLRGIARSTFLNKKIGAKNSQLRPYNLCTSMTHITCK